MEIPIPIPSNHFNPNTEKKYIHAWTDFLFQNYKIISFIIFTKPEENMKNLQNIPLNNAVYSDFTRDSLLRFHNQMKSN